MGRGVPWILLAGLLFLAGAWVASSVEGPAHDERRKRLERLDFPRYPRSEDMDRQRARRVALPVGAANALAKHDSGVAHEEADEKQRVRDPLLAALPPSARTAVVLEASAIRESPVGRLLIQCMAHHGDMSRVRAETGVDPFRDIDRVAIAREGEHVSLVMDGNFTALPASKVFDEKGLERHALGNDGAMYVPRSDGGSRDPDGTVGLWGDRMLLVGDPARLREAVDRLEGRSNRAASALPDDEAYGEIYGRLDPDDAAKLLPAELAPAIREATKNILLHVDARDDVLVVGDVDGPDKQRISDLAKTLGGALSAARLGLRAEGKNDLVELLDMARVQPAEGSFRVETALPLEWVRRQLAHCATDSGR